MSLENFVYIYIKIRYLYTIKVLVQEYILFSHIFHVNEVFEHSLIKEFIPQ